MRVDAVGGETSAIQQARMIGRARHRACDMRSGAASHAPVRRQQRGRRLGRAGGEDDMLGLGADQRRDLAPRVLDRCAARRGLRA